MFEGLQAMETIDISGFDFTNVTRVGYLFNNCKNLKQIIFPQEKIMNCVDFSYLFAYCESLEDPLSYLTEHFNLQNDNKYLSNLFQATNIESIDMSIFNLRTVERMDGLFSYCKKLTNVDWPDYTIENLTTISNLFYYCELLNTIDLRTFDTNKVVGNATGSNNGFDGFLGYYNGTRNVYLGSAE